MASGGPFQIATGFTISAGALKARRWWLASETKWRLSSPISFRLGRDVSFLNGARPHLPKVGVPTYFRAATEPNFSFSPGLLSPGRLAAYVRRTAVPPTASM